MITSFRSRALKRYWERDDESKLPAEDIDRIKRLLEALDAAGDPGDMNLPGYHLYSLKGNQKGRFAVTVRDNWRITFAWDATDAIEVDYEDYH